MNMAHGLSIGMLLLVLAASGCATVDTGQQVAEAARLVEQHLGQLPQWTLPPDQAWEQRAILTLREAVGTALGNNRQLRAELETIGQADADLLQAGLLQNPVISFMIMFPDGGGRSMLRGNGLPMQPLQDLWLIPARKAVARAELQRAILRAADRAVETAAAVKKVYARLQYTQRALQLLRENLEVVNQSTQIIAVQQAAGQATQTAVNLSEIRGLRLRSELMATEAEHKAAQRELLMLMGMAAAPDDWTVEPLSESNGQIEDPPPEDVLLAVATEQRLDFKAAEWEVQSAQAGIQLARREGWPKFAMGLGFERSPASRSNNPSVLGQAGNTAARGLLDRAMGMPSAPMLPEPFSPKMREVKYTVGPMLDLEIPIFDWNQGRIARAVHELQRRMMEYESRYQELVRTVREKRVLLDQAQRQARFYRETVVPAVDRNLDVARRSFVAGQEDLTVYLSVQEDLLMTRLRILEFSRDYLLNLAELERAVGGSLVLQQAAAPPASQPASAPAN